MRLALTLLFILTATAPTVARFDEKLFRDGDIIFHQSSSNQSRAIQLATHSRYSHMGMVWRQDGRWFVYEAVQPVKMTPLAKWIARGAGEHFVVKRLRNRAALTSAVLT